METIMKKVGIPLSKKPKVHKTFKKVGVKQATKINPRKYEKFTTKPDPDKLSKQYVFGLKASQNVGNISGYSRTHGNMRFNTEKLDWVENKSHSYVKNEFNYRPKRPLPLPPKLKMEETLYGFKPVRDSWVPRQVLRKSATIPFVGVKDLNHI